MHPQTLSHRHLPNPPPYLPQNPHYISNHGLYSRSFSYLYRSMFKFGGFSYILLRSSLHPPRFLLNFSFSLLSPHARSFSYFHVQSLKVLFYTQSSYPSNILLISFLNPLRPSLHLHSFLFIPFSSPSFTSSLSYIHSLLLSFVHPPSFPSFHILRVFVRSQRSDSGRVYNDGGGEITQMVHGTTEWLIGVVEPETRINQPKTSSLLNTCEPDSIRRRHNLGISITVASPYYTVDECLVSRQCLGIVLLSLVDCDVAWRSRRVEVSAILVTDDVDWFQCEIPMSYGLTVVMGTGSSPIVTNVNMCEGLNTRHQSYDNCIRRHPFHRCPVSLLQIIKARMLLFICLLLSVVWNQKYLHSW